MKRTRAASWPSLIWVCFVVPLGTALGGLGCSFETIDSGRHAEGGRRRRGLLKHGIVGDHRVHVVRHWGRWSCVGGYS